MKKKITYNSPVVLTFTFACVLVMIAGYMTNMYVVRRVFMVYRTSLTDFMMYIRMFTHVLGHSDWSHLAGNMTYILILGPILEEKYGSKRLLAIMAITAFATGLLNVLLFPNKALLGASGIVFCFIMLASITGDKDSIPLTLILMMIIYIGSEIYNGIFVIDNVSQLTHILGGLIGTIGGFVLRTKEI